jgi:hypothetical protein
MDYRNLKQFFQEAVLVQAITNEKIRQISKNQVEMNLSYMENISKMYLNLFQSYKKISELQLNFNNY